MSRNDRQQEPADAQTARVLEGVDGIHDLLLEGSHDMVLAVDLEGTVLVANDAACRSLGVAREQLVGGPITNRISASVEQVRGKMFRRMVERDEVVEFEDSRGGRMFHHRFVPLHRDGHPAGALFFVRETTAEHRRKQRFRAITDNANDLILELDDHGRIIYANARVAAVLGQAPPDLVGKAPSSLVEPSYRHEVDRRLETLTRGLCSTRTSCPARHTSGKQVWLELTA
ncbi:MAG: PAS domain-containing protein, partial [Planctomycetota bacterium]